MLEHGWIAVYGNYLRVTQVFKATYSVSDYFVLCQFKHDAVFNVPDCVVHEYIQVILEVEVSGLCRISFKIIL
jgi:hypothetical protein